MIHWCATSINQTNDHRAYTSPLSPYITKVYASYTHCFPDRSLLENVKVKKYKYFILENAFQTFKILNIFKLNAMKNIDMFQTKRAVLLNRNCKLGFCTKYLYCSAVSCDVLVVFWLSGWRNGMVNSYVIVSAAGDTKATIKQKIIHKTKTLFSYIGPNWFSTAKHHPNCFNFIKLAETFVVLLVRCSTSAGGPPPPTNNLFPSNITHIFPRIKRKGLGPYKI